jgi:hypothetical protein
VWCSELPVVQTLQMVLPALLVLHWLATVLWSLQRAPLEPCRPLPQSPPPCPHCPEQSPTHRSPFLPLRQPVANIRISVRRKLRLSSRLINCRGFIRNDIIFDIRGGYILHIRLVVKEEEA